VEFFARLVTLVFDALVAPFGSHRSAALVVLSLLTGAGLALLYAKTSDQRRLRRARDVFKARILEMRLYPDDFVLITRALGGALAAQGSYLRAAAKSIFWLLVIAVPVFFQIEARFASRPFRPGERALVTLGLKPELDVHAVPVGLAASPGLSVDPRCVRVPSTREIVWRLTVEQAGDHELVARTYDHLYRFSVKASANGRSLGRRRDSGSIFGALVDAGIPSLPGESAIASVRVGYPDAHYRIAGARWSWLGVFLAGSLVGALVPAWILRIQW
jgi:hypothetical protein